MRTLGKYISVLACTLAMGAVATPAAFAAPVEQAKLFNTEVPCNSGPPEPIQLRVFDGGDICFGGTPGTESVGRTISFMDTGGYYVELFYAIGPECVVTAYRPGRPVAVNAYVCAITIIPPF